MSDKPQNLQELKAEVDRLRANAYLYSGQVMAYENVLALIEEMENNDD